ncbi:hypothetical protein KQI84_18970 [bacterium]|nr:hypothetical protein [bacterium]
MPVQKPAPYGAAGAEMGGTGTISGMLRGMDGHGLGGRTVWITLADSDDADRWSASLTTRPDGTFQISGLKAGRYEVRTELLAEEQLLSDQVVLRLKEGETEHAYLDLSDRIHLSGIVHLSGEPPAKDVQIDLTPEEGGEALILKLEDDGAFSTYIRPGKYRLGVLTELFGLRVSDETIDVLEKPARQAIDVDLPTAEAIVFIIPPEGVKFTQGTLSAEYLTHGNAQSARVFLTEPRYQFPQLLAGTYQAGFRHEDGLQGVSAPTEVGPGLENRIRIPLMEPQDHTYEITVKLPEGRHEYKFFASPEIWHIDDANPQTTGMGVFTNSVVQVPGGAVSEDGKRSAWPVVDDRSGMVTFRVTMPSLRGEVYLRGSFNDWRVDPAYRMAIVD